MQPGSPRSCKSTTTPIRPTLGASGTAPIPARACRIFCVQAGVSATAPSSVRRFALNRRTRMSEALATTKADPLKIHPEDFPDLQGFILHGYNMPKSRHFVLTIGQVQAA